MYAETCSREVSTLDVGDRRVILDDHHQSGLHGSIEQPPTGVSGERGRLLTFLEHFGHRALTWPCHRPHVPG